MTRGQDRAAPEFGFVESFRPGAHGHAETVIAAIAASGASRLRTPQSCAALRASGGRQWLDWLLPRLAARFDVLPCIRIGPESERHSGKAPGAPGEPAGVIDELLARYGRYFSHVELWAEPQDPFDRDRACETIGDAADRIALHGGHAVLGAPLDVRWLEEMGARGLLSAVPVIGLHGAPADADAWDSHLAEVRRIVEKHNGRAELWLTATGHPTWRNDEAEQARRFVAALDAPAARIYWDCWSDTTEDAASGTPRSRAVVVDHAGKPKLLARLLAEGGPVRVREVTALAAPFVGRGARPVLITGGSGFVGSNLAESILRDRKDVMVLDNLSRPGVERNLAWLKEAHGERVHAVFADIRDEQAIAPAVAEADAVFHLAGQTAVTTSLDAPVEDFEINARGTLNVLEAVRRTGRRIPLVLASTNKVYGALADLKLVEAEDRYIPAEREVRRFGVAEDRPLDFCTPYGCSKGAADQYVLDYAASYGIPAAVLRMSCVYGPRQFGTEDQGWVAHFLINALEGRPVAIFGNGKQVRDILHVRDAVVAYRALLGSIGFAKGCAFNLGGGPANAVSLRHVVAEIERLTGRDLAIEWGDWRKGDQPYFVADTRHIEAVLGWSATIPWRRGLTDLAEWLRAERFSDAPEMATPKRAAV